MKLLTFDIETDNYIPEEVENVWCIVIKDHDSGDVHQYGPNAIGRAVRHLSNGDVVIGHNCISFDIPVLRRMYGYKVKDKVVDTLIISRTQRPKRMSPPDCPNKKAPHSVEAWGYRLGRRKVQHEDWTKFSEDMLHRCTEDVELQYLIYKELMNEARGEGWMPAHRLNMKLFTHLQRQASNGWKVDRAHIDRCITQLDRWIELVDRVAVPRLPPKVEVLETKAKGVYNYVKKPFKKDGTLSAVCLNYFDDHHRPSVGGPFSRIHIRSVDLNSNKETKDALLSVGWEPSEYNTNNAGERTSPKLSIDDEFIGIQGSLGRLLVRRVQCTQRRNILKGWREHIREDGTIQPVVSGLASTGRLRHSVIVNVPSPDSGAFYAKQMRSCFVARDGMVMVGADSAGNQMRQLAARMGDQEFTDAVLHGKSSDGTDLHSLNQKRIGVKSRTEAKNFFYGFIFGAQDPKIAKMLGISREEARLIREEYFRKVPKIKALIDNLTEQWRESAKKWFNAKWNKWEFRDGYITGLDGRPILVDSEHKILNYALQSDEAIQMSLAYVLVHDWMERDGYEIGKDWNMLIFYHDEFQAECLPHLSDHLGSTMCEAIKVAGEMLEIACPHGGDYKVGQSWKETH